MGFTLLTIGPLRPLAWELMKLAWASLKPMLFGEEHGGLDSDHADALAWWDKEEEE